MPRLPLSSTVAMGALLLAGCGGDKSDRSQPATVEEAMQQATAAATDAAGGPVDPIPAADLATRLPDQLAGLAAGERSHQDVGMGAMKMSMAKAEYRDGAQRIDVSLTDAGSVGRMSPMVAAWAMVDFDRTTSTGYERTIRFEGYKGVETMSRDGGRLRTELSVIAGDRVIVQLKGVEVDMDQLKDAAKALDLRSIARSDS